MVISDCEEMNELTLEKFLNSVYAHPDKTLRI